MYAISHRFSASSVIWPKNVKTYISNNDPLTDMRYRSKEEIIVSILSAAGSGKQMTLTKLMFNSYLSRIQAIQYSAKLIGDGLLECDGIDKIFKTTPAGFRFLELRNEMSQIFNFQNERRTLREQDWQRLIS